MIKISEIEAKSILQESKLPESDYCVNPYTGCMHGCVYCYARFMKRFTNHEEPWGEFVDVKINASELMKKQISRYKNGKVILLGSVTDCYQPIEKKYEITRNLLRTLLQAQAGISILTKSKLVIRDIDLLRQFKDCSVGLTLTTSNDFIRQMIEPRTSSVQERIEALKALHNAGIKTYVFFGPIIPTVTDLAELFRKIIGITDNIWGEVLNVRGGNWKGLENALSKIDSVNTEQIYQDSRNAEYWDQIEREFKNLSAFYNIPQVGFYRH